MKNVTHSNGIVLSYDDTIKVGDLVTGYHKGFHEVKEIVHRGPDVTPLIRYICKFNAKGVKSKGVENCCDASYCKKVSNQIDNIISEKIKEVERFQLIKKMYG